MHFLLLSQAILLLLFYAFHLFIYDGFNFLVLKVPIVAHILLNLVLELEI